MGGDEEMGSWGRTTVKVGKEDRTELVSTTVPLVCYPQMLTSPQFSNDLITVSRWLTVSSSDLNQYLQYFLHTSVTYLKMILLTL